MKKEIIGIVVEFNPFHNGHKNLIDTIKKENPNATIIAAMSGQFVQRGELSIYNKWSRAKCAIHNGVDLVVEIPPFFVLNHANIFAKKSIEILKKYGASKIYFGSENLTINKINKIVDKIIKNEDEIDSLKKEFHSLPRAISNFLKTDLKPNDTLGICYILESKKNNIDIEFHRVKREMNEKYSSASKIRENIYKNGVSFDSFISSDDEVIRNIENYSDLILGKILLYKGENRTIKYLANKIFENPNYEKSFFELINNSANKNFTKSTLKREVIKLILNLKGDDFEIVLASSNKGKEILKNIDNYYFRHTKDNMDNLQIEKFISLKNKTSIRSQLSKSTLWL